MLLTRLLVLGMLVSLCAGQAPPQSQAGNGSGVASSNDNPSIKPSGELPEPRMREFAAEWRAPSEPTCYTIRSYVVVRDSPRSDTTHSNGYSTCVPGARIHMYSTVDHGR